MAKKTKKFTKWIRVNSCNSWFPHRVIVNISTADEVFMFIWANSNHTLPGGRPGYPACQPRLESC